MLTTSPPHHTNGQSRRADWTVPCDRCNRPTPRPAAANVQYPWTKQTESGVIITAHLTRALCTPCQGRLHEFINNHLNNPSNPSIAYY